MSATADLDQTKARLCAVVDDLAASLVAVSHDLHAHPELGFGEVHAHQVLTDAEQAQLFRLLDKIYIACFADPGD